MCYPALRHRGPRVPPWALFPIRGQRALDADSTCRPARALPSTETTVTASPRQCGRRAGGYHGGLRVVLPITADRDTSRLYRRRVPRTVSPYTPPPLSPAHACSAARSPCGAPNDVLTAAARPPVPRWAARRLFACADFLLKGLYLEKGARVSPNGARPPSVCALVTECARALAQAHAPFAAFAPACTSAIAAPAPAALTGAGFAAESVSSPSHGLQPALSGTRSRPAAALRGVAHGGGGGGGGGGCVGGDDAVHSAAGAVRTRGWGARRVLSGCLARPTERDSVTLIMQVLVAVHAVSARHRRSRRAR